MIRLAATHDFDFSSPAYRDLFAASSASAFQHPDWLDPFYRIMVPAEGVEPLTVTGHSASGELVLAVPLVRRAGAGRTTVEYAFLGVTDYACPVVRRDALPELAGLSGRFRDLLRPAGRLRIGPVYADHVAPWRALLAAEPCVLGFSAHALDLRRRDGSPFGARRRNDLARKAARLGPDLHFELLAPGEIRAAFAEARTFRRSRFAGDPLQSAHGLEFYAEVARRGAQSGLARSWRLRQGSRTVAILFGLADGKRFCYLLLACDYTRFARSSPGLLAFDRAIRAWRDSGGWTFDFTIGDEPYKRDLGCVPTPMYEFVAGLD